MSCWMLDSVEFEFFFNLFLRYVRYLCSNWISRLLGSLYPFQHESGKMRSCIIIAPDQICGFDVHSRS